MIESVQSLKVFQWNANGIRNKIIEFYDFILRNGADVVCLNETFLKPEIKLHSNPKFSIIRLDRLSNSKGGIAILVKKHIKYDAMQHIKTNILECLGIRICLENGRKIEIIAAYLPGGTTTAQINQYYVRDLEILARRNCSYFVCGDLNSKHRFWNCQRANRAGTLLYQEYTCGNFLIAHPPCPTFYPANINQSPSTIDLVLTNGKLCITEPVSIPMNSDHNSVSFEIKLNSSIAINDPQMRPSFVDADWSVYRKKIDDKLSDLDIEINDITTAEEIDKLTDFLSESIMEAQSCSIPLKIPNKYELHLTPEIRELIIMRNQMRRQWQRNRNFCYKNVVCNLNVLIKDEIQKLRNSNWNFKLSNIKPSHQNLWTAVKLMKKPQIMPPLKLDDSLALTADEKANALADTFEKAHSNPLSNNKPSFTNKINENVDKYLRENESNSEEIELPDINEIRSHIKGLKNNKAPDYDRIHNRLIKKLPSSGINFLHLIQMEKC